MKNRRLVLATWDKSRANWGQKVGKKAWNWRSGEKVITWIIKSHLLPSLRRSQGEPDSSGRSILPGRKIKSSGKRRRSHNFVICALADGKVFGGGILGRVKAERKVSEGGTREKPHSPRVLQAKNGYAEILGRVEDEEEMGKTRFIWCGSHEELANFAQRHVISLFYQR